MQLFVDFCGASIVISRKIPIKRMSHSDYAQSLQIFKIRVLESSAELAQLRMYLSIMIPHHKARSCVVGDNARFVGSPNHYFVP